MNYRDIKLGLVKDKQDDRDYGFKARTIFKGELPPAAHVGIVAGDNQGSRGACTAYSLAKIIEYFYMHEYGLSRYYQYYNCRKADGAIRSDNGTSLRNALKVYNRYGMCLEEFHPSIDFKEQFFTEPTSSAYADGKKKNRIEYSRVYSLKQYKEAIASGSAVYAGIAIYDSFYDTSKDGIVHKNSGALNGYHAIAMSGYDDKKGYIECVNSWGKEWGDNGKFYIPYEMFNDEMFIDIWAVDMLDKAVGDGE